MARGAELAALVYQEVMARHGSISAEHGLGLTKRDVAASYLIEVEGDLMRAIKRALEPEGLMNQGKLLPASGRLEDR
jgi:FAD/FMN-containing dehydrogenase